MATVDKSSSVHVPFLRHGWKLSKLQMQMALKSAANIRLWDGDSAGYEKWSADIEELAHMLKLHSYLIGQQHFPTLNEIEYQ